jgi:hypothetical protein
MGVQKRAEDRSKLPMIAGVLVAIVVIYFIYNSVTSSKSNDFSNLGGFVTTKKGEKDTTSDGAVPEYLKWSNPFGGNEDEEKK